MLARLIKETKSVTDESGMTRKHDYSKAKTTTVSNVIDVRDTFHLTNGMPQQTLFIVPAKIKKTSNNIFSSKSK